MSELETLDARLARLVPETEIKEPRRESLLLAHDAGVSDEIFGRLASALRLARKATIVLPAHHYESLSRGRGWCRQGKGDAVVWGERVDNGYRVGPGRWSVGATDGFSRKKTDEWTVKHVQVGAETWTVAS